MEVLSINGLLGLGAKYGIGALVIVVLCLISYRIIRHILAQSDIILKQAMEAQKEWQRVIEAHNTRAAEYHTQITEAHRFQREEHMKILACLSEVEKGLGRINGYKAP